MARPFAVVVALALATAAWSAAAAPRRTSATGTIKVIRLHRITVHGSRDVSCRIAARSPRVAGLTVGTRASITCVDGVLRLLVRLRTPEPVSPGPTVPAPAGVYVVLGGSITALSASSITVGGKVTCSIGPRSPELGGFHVGSSVTGRCDGGVLTALSHATGS